MTAAACVLLLMRKGVRWLDAKGDTANLLFADGSGDKAVETAYTQYRSELKDCPDGDLLEILGSLADTPTIKRIMAG